MKTTAHGNNGNGLTRQRLEEIIDEYEADLGIGPFPEQKLPTPGGTRREVTPVENSPQKLKLEELMDAHERDSGTFDLSVQRFGDGIVKGVKLAS